MATTPPAAGTHEPPFVGGPSPVVEATRPGEAEVVAPTRAWVPARIRWVVLVLVAVVYLAIGLHQAGRDAPTIDEGVDVSSGVSYLVRHDLRMNPEHPALPKAVAALPALMAHPIVPDSDAWRRGDWFDWSDDFISANERAGRLDDILFWSRAMVLLEGLACAALLYVLTKRFFGPDGALLAAVAWLTTPYVVGLGHFAMVDVPFVLVTLAVCVVLARWVDRPHTGRSAELGVVLGVALASRHTGLVLCLAVVAVMAHTLRRAPRDALREVALTTGLAVVTLWLVYRGLAPGGSSARVQAQFEGLVSSQGGQSAPVRLLGSLPLPLEWRAGFAYLDLTSTARPSSLLGQSWDGGRWWYFPASAALKLPLTLVAGIVAGWALAVRRARSRRALLTFVVGPALALWAFLVAQPLNLGLRLALPVVALAFVGLGALVPARPEAEADAQADAPTPLRRLPVGLGVAGALLAVQLVATAVAVPHSLAWTPRPWTPAYRWVSDANLDAGQALYEVREWAKTHDRPYVALDATRGLAVEGGSRSMKDVDPASIRGWVAVGVTPLMQTRRDDQIAPGAGLAWLRKYCPVGTLGGGSVLVYRFVRPPDASPGPERPVAPCFGARSSADRT